MASESRFALGKSRTEKLDINVDEELERFVAQIEENTFTILSIKQKFGLMKANSASFEEETTDRLASFEKQIDNIEQSVSRLISNFNKRLNQMELLAFRPEMYHPSKVITVPDSHQITSVFYGSDLICIGTDTSRVIMYNAKTGQFANEIGPVDGNPITRIGNVSRTVNMIFAVQTAGTTIHIIDQQKPTQKRVIDTPVYCTWQSHLSSPFRMATVESKMVNLYNDSLAVTRKIGINAVNLFPAPDRLIVQVNDRKLQVYRLGDEEVVLEREFAIPFNIKLVTASHEHLAVSGESNSIAVCNLDGTMNLVDVGGPSYFLFSWGEYYFRLGDDTLIQCRDFENKKEPVKIGDEAWWPHSSQTKLVSCTIYESCLVTAMDLTCVMWS